MRLFLCYGRVWLAMAVVFAVKCGGPPARPLSHEPIAIDGSSTVYPISEAVAAEFRRAHPGSVVSVEISGTGGGFLRFCAGATDIQNASRPIREDELEQCAGGGVEFVEIPIALDGLTVIVHPQNSWAKSMTVTELKRLWEPAADGEVTRWSQIRRGWPDSEIHLFGPGSDSGTYDFFTQVVIGEIHSSRGDYKASEDDNELVRAVSADPLALGFLGYDYYEQNLGRLSAVAIDDEQDDVGPGPIPPSPENVRRGVYRPFSRYLFIYINKRSLDRPEVQAFVQTYLPKDPTRAMARIKSVGAIPLTIREYELTMQRTERRVAGTLFADNHQPSTNLELLLSR